MTDLNLTRLDQEQLVKLLGLSDEQINAQFPLPLPPESFGHTQPAFPANLVRRQAMLALLRTMSIADALDSSQVHAAVDCHGMTRRVANFAAYWQASARAAQAALAGLDARPAAVHIAGLGGSAIGPTIAVELLRNMGYAAPATIHRHYPDPSIALGPDTLLVVSSYSGNTEESLAWYALARRAGAPVVCVAKAGKLRERAAADGCLFIPIPVDAFTGDDATQQPRESIGFSVATFLSLFARLGIAVRDGNPGDAFSTDGLDLSAVAPGLSGWDAAWRQSTPFAENLAKQLAAHFLYGRAPVDAPLTDPAAQQTVPLVLVDQSNEALGKRIENQFGECVTAAIKVLTLFEDAHNEVEQAVTCAVAHEVFGRPDPFSYVVVRSDAEVPRARQRLDATIHEAFAVHGIAHKVISAQGDTPLEQKLYLLKLLDYVRAYSSVLAGVEPLGVPFMNHMKDRMNETPWPDNDPLPGAQG